MAKPLEGRSNLFYGWVVIIDGLRTVACRRPCAAAPIIIKTAASAVKPIATLGPIPQSPTLSVHHGYSRSFDQAPRAMCDGSLLHQNPTRPLTARWNRITLVNSNRIVTYRAAVTISIPFGPKLNSWLAPLDNRIRHSPVSTLAERIRPGTSSIVSRRTILYRRLRSRDKQQ